MSEPRAPRPSRAAHAVALAAAGLALAAAPGPARADTRPEVPPDATLESYLVSPGQAHPPLLVASVDVPPDGAGVAVLPAPDGQASVVRGAESIEVRYDGRRVAFAVPPGQPGALARRVAWHPDARRLAFLTPLEGDAVGVATVDVRTLPAAGGRALPRIVYAAPVGVTPLGLAWAPRGDALLLLARRFGEPRVDSVVIRLSRTWSAEVLVEVADAVDFVAPSPALAGGGWELLFPAGGRLHLSDAAGRDLRELDLPGDGLADVEWAPDGGAVALLYDRRVPYPPDDGFSGLYLLALDRAGGEHVLTPIDGDPRIHTVWFAPAGDRLAWATPEAVAVRPVAAEAETTRVELDAVAGDASAEVHAVRWHPDRPELVLALSNRVFRYGLEDGELRELATFGRPATHRAHDARWTDGRVLVTVSARVPGLRPSDR